MLSTDAVKNITLLARIGVKEEEVEKYRKELSATLNFFHELETLPTEGVEPIGHITGMTNVARTDQAEDFDASGKAAIKKNFPDAKDGFLKARSVF